MYTEEFVPYLFHVTPGTFHELFVLVLTKCVKVFFFFLFPFAMTYFNSITTVVIRDVSLLRHTLVINKCGTMYFDFKQCTPVWLKIFPL